MWIYLHSRSRHSVTPGPYVEDAFFLSFCFCFFFPLYGFDFFVKNQFSLRVCVWFQGLVFNSLTLTNLPDPIPIPCRFYYYCSLVRLAIRDSYTSRCSLLLLIVLAILGFLFLHMKFGMVLGELGQGTNGKMRVGIWGIFSGISLYHFKHMALMWKIKIRINKEI